MNKETLPMFPLRLMAYPQQPLNLHIFEPRYRQLMQDCLSGEQQLFGIPPFLQGGLGLYGTLVKLEEVSKIHPGGELDVKTRGVIRFKLERYFNNLDDKLYPGAEIIPFEDEPYLEDQLLRKRIWERYLQFFQVMNMEAPRQPFPGEPLSFQIAGKAGLNLEQEMELIRLKNENERLEFLEAHFDTMLPLLVQIEELKERIKLNGHFRRMNSPEM